MKAGCLGCCALSWSVVQGTLAHSLRADPSIELLVAGRRIVPVPAAEDVPSALLDIEEAGFAQVLRALTPQARDSLRGAVSAVAREVVIADAIFTASAVVLQPVTANRTGGGLCRYLPPVSIRHRSSARPAAGHDDGFSERSTIFLLADRIHRP